MKEPKDKFRTLDDPEPKPDIARLSAHVTGPHAVVSDRIEPVRFVACYGLGRRIREAVRLLFTGRIRID